MQIPSPVQAVHHSVFRQAGLEVCLKREDLIHPAISGNKWRKLKYNLAEMKESGAKGFITFGGAYSNHLAAAAYAAALHGFKMVAVVRGIEAHQQNPTLDFLRQCGVEIVPISRSAYKQKNEAEFLAQLQNDYPGYEIIPEGGSNLAGVQGCAEILKEVETNYDVVVAPLGTSTTFSGLLLSGLNAAEYLGFPAVKGGAYLTADVNNFISQAKHAGFVPATFGPPVWELVTDYHFGGFGKVKPELIAFMNEFYRQTGIPLDPIYTAKMFFGLCELAKKGTFKKGTRILAIHTGGLQGIKGMNERLRKKNLHIDYEEAVAAAFPPPPH